jgi:hypothetical protein
MSGPCKTSGTGSPLRVNSDEARGPIIVRNIGSVVSTLFWKRQRIGFPGIALLVCRFEAEQRSLNDLSPCSLNGEALHVGHRQEEAN